MRQTGLWMKWTDERILEYLAENGKVSPWILADEMETDSQYVTHRCYILANAELVERVAREQIDDEFAISTWGRLYLNGDLDAQHRQPQPSPRPPDKVRPAYWAEFGQNISSTMRKEL